MDILKLWTPESDFFIDLLGLNKSDEVTDFFALVSMKCPYSRQKTKL
jgi:hypothetical protein